MPRLSIHVKAIKSVIARSGATWRSPKKILMMEIATLPSVARNNEAIAIIAYTIAYTLVALRNRGILFIVMTMKIFLGIAAAGIVLFLLDRILLKMESRGWIYYRRKKPSQSSLGNAFLEIQSMLEPSKKVLVEIKKEEKKEQADSGDPPKPG